MRRWTGPVNFRDLTYITANLRKQDQLECFCQRDYTDGFTLAMEVIYVAGTDGQFAQIAYLGDQPVAAFGVAELRQGLWNFWAFGTSRFPKVALTMTCTMVDEFVPRVIEAGGRRIMAYSIESHKSAHSLLLRCGAKFEAKLPDFGHGGETFFQFAWTRTGWLAGDYDHVFQHPKNAEATIAAQGRGS